ncbi:hypothetical protein [Janthinobacterium sp. GB4P2]|uniref:hypothetical protein n=1 Tax=Janthinobacterium sp. GB4P2 TaxID=3424189 RepID=UPI003F527896
MLLSCEMVIIAALAGMQRRLDSTIIEQKQSRKTMTATRHDTSTVNAYTTTTQSRSLDLTAGAFA